MAHNYSSKARLVWTVVGLVVLLLLVSAAHPISPDSVEVIVQAKDTSTAASLVLRHDGEVLRNLSIIDSVVARVDAGTVDRLRHDTSIGAVWPNRRVSIAAPPAEQRDAKVLPPDYYGSVASGAYEVHRKGITGKGVTVAIVDSGFPFTPELNSRMDGRPAGAPRDGSLFYKARDGQFILYKDFLEPDSPHSKDPFGHGTHVAGTIADPHYALLYDQDDADDRSERDGDDDADRDADTEEDEAERDDGEEERAEARKHENTAKRAASREADAQDERHNDGEGSIVAGIAPDANLVIARAINGEGAGTYADVIAAIDWIVEMRDIYGVDVLNLSLYAPVEGPYWVDPLNQAIMKAWHAGITVVVAAGNDGPDPVTIGTPGNVPYVITVGASRAAEYSQSGNTELLDFSSRGPTESRFVKPDVLMPGWQIVAPMPKDSYLANLLGESTLEDEGRYLLEGIPTRLGYYPLSGTSMSSAAVSGVVALILQQNPDLTNDQVKGRLMETAELAYDEEHGRAVYSIWEQGAGQVNTVDAVFDPVNVAANDALDINADLDTGPDGIHYTGFTGYDPDEDAFVIGDMTEPRDYFRWAGDNIVDPSSKWVWSGSKWVWSGSKWVWSGGNWVWSGSKWVWSGSKWVWSGGKWVWSGSKWVWSGSKWVWSGGYYVQSGSKWIWTGSKWVWSGSDGYVQTESKWVWSGSKWVWSGGTPANIDLSIGITQMQD